MWSQHAANSPIQNSIGNNWEQFCRVRFLTTPILPGRGHLVYPLIGSYGVYRTTTGQVKGYTELQVTLGVGTVVWEFRIILLSQ